MTSIFKAAREQQASPSNTKSPEIEKKSSIFKDIPSRQPPEEPEASFMPEQEGAWASMGRNAARFGQDVADVAMGAPGSGLSLINSFTSPIYANIAHAFGSDEKPIEYEDMPISKGFPTINQLMQRRPDYLKPKNDSEREASEITQDTAALLIGPDKKKAGIRLASNIAKLGQRVTKALGLSALGSITKKGAQKAGFSEETANYVKMGTILGGSILNEAGMKGADKYKSELYKEAESARGPNASINANRLSSNLNSAKRNLEKGGSAPSATTALKKVNEMITHIGSNAGRISVEELEAFATKINELKANLYEEFGVDKVGRKSAKRNLDNLTHITENAIEQYGVTNPKYSLARNAGKEVHGAIEGSKKITRFVKNNLKEFALTGVGSAIAQAIYNPEMLLPSLGYGLAAAGVVTGGELIARIMMSPKLAKYYTNVLVAAAKEDAVFLSHEMGKLQKAIEEDPEQLIKD